MNVDNAIQNQHPHICHLKKNLSHTCRKVPCTTPGTRISQPNEPSVVFNAFRSKVQSFETWNITLQNKFQSNYLGSYK